jgi:toxin ParE1/3/4
VKTRAVVFSPEARRDLLDLYQTIAGAASPTVALAYIERIEGFCLRFDLASERGQRRDDIRPGLRVTGFERRIAVAFTVGDGEVTILRLFSGGRNWEETMR